MLLHVLIFLLIKPFIKAHFVPYLYFYCTLRSGRTTQEDFQLHFQNRWSDNFRALAAI